MISCLIPYICSVSVYITLYLTVAILVLGVLLSARQYRHDMISLAAGDRNGLMSSSASAASVTVMDKFIIIFGYSLLQPPWVEPGTSRTGLPAIESISLLTSTVFFSAAECMIFRHFVWLAPQNRYPSTLWVPTLRKPVLFTARLELSSKALSIVHSLFCCKQAMGVKTKKEFTRHENGIQKTSTF